MATEVKVVRNRNIIQFDKGAFDDWCVFLTRPGRSRYAPRDTEYFGRLKVLGNRHGHQKIYNDFLRFYALTNRRLDAQVLQLITTLADTYAEDAEEVDIWFTVIYAGMVAEENKVNAILKKRIKRLGMHQVLIEGLEPDYAASFSKGKKWRELDALMRERGF